MKPKMYLRGTIWWTRVPDANGKFVRKTTRQRDYNDAARVATAMGGEYLPRPKVNAAHERKKAGKARIYFIQSGENGPIKIGIADYPEERMAHLQAGNPEKLHLRVDVLGSVQLEQSLHKFLADTRIRGEWFAASRELLTIVRGLSDRTLTAQRLADVVVTTRDQCTLFPGLQD